MLCYRSFFCCCSYLKGFECFSPFTVKQILQFIVLFRLIFCSLTKISSLPLWCFVFTFFLCLAHHSAWQDHTFTIAIEPVRFFLFSVFLHCRICTFFNSWNGRRRENEKKKPYFLECFSKVSTSFFASLIIFPCIFL